MIGSSVRIVLCTVLAFVALSIPRTAGARTAAPLRITVDASRAPQKIDHVRVSLPATSGPFAFVYPKWIPGHHGPGVPSRYASDDAAFRASPDRIGVP